MDTKLNRQQFWEGMIGLLNFTGYYIFLMLIIAAGFITQSRIFTIPLRLLAVILCVYFLSKAKVSLLTKGLFFKLFVMFWVFYLVRVIYDTQFTGYTFSMEANDYIFYSVAICIIPGLYFLAPKSLPVLNLMEQFLRVGGAFFCVLCIFIYLPKFSTQGHGRLSQIDDMDGILSPLAASYVSAMAMSLALIKLFNAKEMKVKILNMAIIGMSVPPFLMGASRGGLIAVVIPFVMEAIFTRKYKRLVVCALGAILVILPLMIKFSESIGSSFFDRVGNMVEDASGETSAGARTIIWKTSLEQFADSPIWGNFIENTVSKHYSHNILIEALMATGVIGFGLLLVMIILGFKVSLAIFRNRMQDYYWIPTIFFQCFCQYMVSGSIWGASWFWCALCLTISLTKTQAPAEERRPVLPMYEPAQVN